MKKALCIFVYYIYFFITTNAQGPDPWKRSKIFDVDTKSDALPNCDCTQLNTTSKNVDNHDKIFFKKIIDIILKNGDFQHDEHGYVNGKLHFRFIIEEYNEITKLSNNKAVLTPKDFRKIHGIFLNRIVGPTFFDTVINKTTATFSEYKIFIIYFACLAVTLYILLKMDFTPVFTMRMVVVSFCVIMYFWEYQVIQEEIKIHQYNSMFNSKVISWLLSFFGANNPITINTVDSVHPLTIIIRLFIKIYNGLLIGTLDGINVLARNASGNIPILSHVLHIIILISLSLIFIHLFWMIFTAMLLGKPFKMSFFGLHYGINEQDTQNSNNSSAITTVPAITQSPPIINIYLNNTQPEVNQIKINQSEFDESNANNKNSNDQKPHSSNQIETPSISDENDKHFSMGFFHKIFFSKLDKKDKKYKKGMLENTKMVLHKSERKNIFYGKSRPRCSSI